MKQLILSIISIVLLLTLTGCGKFTCNICGKEKSGKKYEEEMFGQKITICKDCYEDMQELAGMFGLGN